MRNPTIARALRASLFVLAAQTGAAQEPWSERLLALNEADWSTAFATGLELAALAPDEGFELLEEHWERIGLPSSRQQLLKAWQYGTPYPLRARFHPRLLDALALGMEDEDGGVREFALVFLEMTAMREFDDDGREWRAWLRANRGRPIVEVLEGAARELAKDARAARDDARRRAWLERFDGARSILRDAEAAREALLEAKLPALLEGWLEADDPQVVAGALGALATLEPRAQALDRMLPAWLAAERAEPVFEVAAELAGERKDAWARDALVEALRREVLAPRKSRGRIWAVARGLAALAEPTTIPAMVAAMEADGTYDTLYGVGYFGLARLTGVEYDEERTAADWRAWWEENRARFEGCAELEVPAWPARTDRSEASPAEPEDRDLPSFDLLAGEDPRKRYFLVGPRASEKPPRGGFGLVLVLPGGDGSADFHDFVRSIHREAVPQGFLLAQLVAPKWEAEQFERIVWPTRRNPYAGMGFSTEELAAAAIEDVAARQPLDRGRVLTLSWSSGGPAAYALSLDEELGIAGSFVAMSVFKPDELSSLRAAKGKAYYLLHSPQDWIPIAHAERAREALSRAKAEVELATYEGGHGWHGDVFGTLRRGFSWLAERTGGR